MPSLNASSAPRIHTGLGETGRKGWVHALARWSHRYSSRRSLARLDDDMLRDIGLSRAQAEDEALLPFWKP
ncbi:DUF1127 domain-containing protein [Pseudoroseicyclus sp. H15]